MARFLVPVSDDPASEHALNVASNACFESGDEICAVYVVRVPSQLPISADLPMERARAERVLDRASDVANRCGVSLTTLIVEARRVGVAVVEAARGCDCIVIGRPTRRDFYRRFVLDRTLRYVLRHAPCQVLISYAPPPGQAMTQAQHYLLSDAAPSEMPDNISVLHTHPPAAAGSRSS